MRILSPSTCCFCNKTIERPSYSGGQWHTYSGAVTCCHHCATDVLPRLMADSIHLRPEGEYQQATSQLQEANGNFWKAMAARLSSRGGE